MKSGGRWRAAPAIGLFLLAPLVAEFLLGNLPITMLFALLVLAPLYGGGAVLIREVVRRTRRGWPSIIVLALAYGVFEEAFTTQTLFNPNYLKLNLHLLQPAYIPALGIGAWWTVFVLTLHTVWSISTSIALVEALVPQRASAPWLGRTGLVMTSLLFAAGALAATLFALKDDPFVASTSQFAVSGVVLAGLIVVAFRLPPPTNTREPGPVPSPWLAGAIALTASSAFLLIPNRWGWWTVKAYLALDMVVIAAVYRWSRRAAWDGRHRLALAGGAALSYAWHAFPEHPVVGGAGVIDTIGNVVFACGLIVLLAFAARRISAVPQRHSVPPEQPLPAAPMARSNLTRQHDNATTR
jgi:hypothetical protein